MATLELLCARADCSLGVPVGQAAGETIDVADSAEAARMIKNGIAKPAAKAAGRAGRVETAARPTPQNAARRTKPARG